MLPASGAVNFFELARSLSLSKHARDDPLPVHPATRTSRLNHCPSDNVFEWSGADNCEEYVGAAAFRERKIGIVQSNRLTYKNKAQRSHQLTGPNPGIMLFSTVLTNRSQGLAKDRERQQVKERVAL